MATGPSMLEGRLPVNPWERVDSDGALTLRRRGQAWLIDVGGQVLMSTEARGSEEALADLVVDKVGGAARLLVGGLGLGFTAARALARLGPRGQVCVAERSAAVARWNAGPLGEAAGRPLDDERLDVFVGDVREAMQALAPFDGILLDVDNGPDALSHPENAWLYGAEGLATARSSLAPGGVLAVWSAGPDDRFTARLRAAHFVVEVVRPRGGRGRGSTHVVWLGCRR